MRIFGLVPALVTPVRPDGSIDPETSLAACCPELLVALHAAVRDDQAAATRLPEVS